MAIKFARIVKKEGEVFGREDWENAEVTYEGAVMCTREENYYDDSDYYAVVWDEEKQCLKRVDYDTTRFAGGGRASVDYTEEVEAKAAAWLKALWIEKLNDWNDAQAAEPAKDKTVKVVKGRKVKIGTVAKVFWAGWVPNKFDYNRSQIFRVGLLIDGEKVYTDGRNVEVIDPDQYLKPADEIDKLADQRKYSWHAPFTRLGIVL